MRLLASLLVLFLFGTHSLSAQFIGAGQYAPGQYFVDIQPDTTIEAPDALTPKYAMYPLDMNGDGQFDFELHVANFGGLGGDYVRCYIEPRNNNQIAFAKTDSCFALPTGCFNDLIWVYGMARAFEYGEQIDNSTQWADSLLYLSYNSYVLDCFSCSGETFIHTDTNYLGVRVLTPTDTVYGWIKVSGISDITCTIESFASESATVGTKEKHTANASVRVFPNPATNLLRFDFGQILPAKAMIDVWNNMGRPVMRQELETNTHAFNCDVASFASGVYFYSVRVPGKEAVAGRFVIAD